MIDALEGATVLVFFVGVTLGLLLIAWLIRELLR